MYARFLVCSLLVVLCCAFQAGAAAAAGVGPALAVEDAAAYIAATGDLVLLDVRNSEELEEGAYPGALNIPLKELESRLQEIPSGRPVLIYCARGVRAKKAYDLLRVGRPDIQNLVFIRGTPDFRGVK